MKRRFLAGAAAVALLASANMGDARGKTRDVAFLYRMPAGIPGDVTRAEHATIEAGVITASGVSGAPLAFGLGMVLDTTTGKWRTPVAQAGAAITGIFVRPYPTGATQDGLNTSTPQASGPCDIMRRGYIIVKLQNTTAAAKGGAVYVRVAANTSTLLLGGFEAADDGADTDTVTGAFFMSAADANGFVEIGFNL